MTSRLHFLNTENSDCIIIESNGKFAMIDAGEDTEYPADKPHLNLKGFEKEVVKYINEHCSDENGNVTFEFILGTHAHSDHIGGFDTVINQPNVYIKKAYLKPYCEEGINKFEIREWDNLQVYTQMINALNKKSVPVIEAFDRLKETIGEFDITFYNGTYVKPERRTGENRNSVFTLVEKNGKRALLAADMEYKYGAERLYGDIVGRVDLLKVAHHGYLTSTTARFLKKLMPRYAVICNLSERVNRETKQKLNDVSKSKIFYTGDSNGIIVEFNEEINITENIMQR